MYSLLATKITYKLILTFRVVIDLFLNRLFFLPAPPHTSTDTPLPPSLGHGALRFINRTVIIIFPPVIICIVLDCEIDSI